MCGTKRACGVPADSSVLTTPGITQVTSIGVPRSSARTASDTPTTKCFVPEYVAPPAKPTLPAVEAMFTT